MNMIHDNVNIVLFNYIFLFVSIGYLARDMTNKREYNDILNILNEARLDICCELESSWKFEEPKLICNSNLENNFIEKRSEMRELGKKDFKEQFCFLVVPKAAVVDICHHGLSVKSSTIKMLGNPQLGVYVFRHIDVALNYAKMKNSKSNIIVVFKTLFGRIKKVQPVLNSKKTPLDPAPNYDSHMSKSLASWTDSFEKQTANSLVYLYEYDLNCKPADKPRHCLPYASVSAAFIEQKTETGPMLATVKLKPKLLTDGSANLMNCTVAKRIGKGKDAKIVFENFRTIEPKPPPMYAQQNEFLLSCSAINLLLENLLYDKQSMDSAMHFPDHFDKKEKAGKRTDDIEGLSPSSMLITSKSIKDPRIRKEEQELKHCDQKIVDQLNFQHCEENVNKSLSLSFEEARLFDSLMAKDKVNKCSLFNECEKDYKMVMKQNKTVGRHSQNLSEKEVFEEKQQKSSMLSEMEHSSLTQDMFHVSKSLSVTNTVCEKVVKKGHQFFKKRKKETYFSLGPTKSELTKEASISKQKKKIADVMESSGCNSLETGHKHKPMQRKTCISNDNKEKTVNSKNMADGSKCGNNPEENILSTNSSKSNHTTKVEERAQTGKHVFKKSPSSHKIKGNKVHGHKTNVESPGNFKKTAASLPKNATAPINKMDIGNIKSFVTGADKKEEHSLLVKLQINSCLELNDMEHSIIKKKTTAENQIPEKLFANVEEELPWLKQNLPDNQEHQCSKTITHDIILAKEEILIPPKKTNSQISCVTSDDNFEMRDFPIDYMEFQNETVCCQELVSLKVGSLKESEETVTAKTPEINQSKTTDCCVESISSMHLKELAFEHQISHVLLPENKVVNQHCTTDEIYLFDMGDIGIPTETSILSVSENLTHLCFQSYETEIGYDGDLLIEDMEIGSETEIPSFETMNEPKAQLPIHLNISLNMLLDDFDCSHLENRIDWNSLFGLDSSTTLMEEDVVPQFHKSPLQKCGLYKCESEKIIYSDLQITVKNYSKLDGNHTPACCDYVVKQLPYDDVLSSLKTTENTILMDSIKSKNNAAPLIDFIQAPHENVNINASDLSFSSCTSNNTQVTQKANDSYANVEQDFKCHIGANSGHSKTDKGGKLKGCTQQKTRSPDKGSSVSLNVCAILEKADKTSCVNVLQEYKLICEKMLPRFINAFKDKQHCPVKDVMVNRKFLLERNLKAAFKYPLKPQAIEAFIELQMMMETKQFIENRIYSLKGEPTFRSLLYYDSSLYLELLDGDRGYQQQSNFYVGFQQKLKCDPLVTLENHHAQLCDVLEKIHEKCRSYYVLLKYRREVEECEAVLKNSADHLDFCLSVPLSCGVHTGDTLEELKNLQTGTLELIKAYYNLPDCDAGKQEHALCLLELICAKIDYIQTSESLNTELSLFGIEHLLFDAAKSTILKENARSSKQKKIPSLILESIHKLNHFALLKLYEVYGTCVEETTVIKTSGDKQKKYKESNFNPEFNSGEDVYYVGKIIDQARCADTASVNQMIAGCKKHLEALKKYFQIMQECDADEVIITENNVFDAAKKNTQPAILLKPEAIESYIDILMAYETLHFLKCLKASKKNKKRFRGLLWFEKSLLPELILSQNRIGSYLKANLNSDVIEVINSNIYEIKTELEIICDYSDSVNYTYALQIMTRELSELSELKTFVSKSRFAMQSYIHFSPHIASLHYGSTLVDLDHNYNQFSDLLGLLMSCPKKDLGKIAQTMKIMKTIELMKQATSRSDTSAFGVCSCQIMENKRKREHLQDKGDQCYWMLNTKKRPSLVQDDQTYFTSPKKRKVVNSPPHDSKGEQEKSKQKSNTRIKNKDHSNAAEKQCKKSEKTPKDVTGVEIKDQSSSINEHTFQKNDGLSSVKAIVLEHANDREVKIKCSTDDPVKEVLNDSHLNLHTKSQLQVPDKNVNVISEHQSLSDQNKKNTDVVSQTAEQKSILKKLYFSGKQKKSNNVHFADICSLDTSPTMEQKNETATPITEAKDKKNEPLVQHNDPSSCSDLNNSHSQSFTQMTGTYSQLSSCLYPWQYYLHYWYQNSSNTGVMTQPYQGMPYNTQQFMPYNGTSLFTTQNPYTGNQPYPYPNSQVPPQMFQTTDALKATMNYSYPDPHSASQDSVQARYAYDATPTGTWSWGSW
uniref:Testis expressed 15, meiosis and synapsis associated n=1 Tax=Xenopus tropicalis TaxID=8364 RepID=A0A803J2C4_XENTR